MSYCVGWSSSRDEWMPFFCGTQELKVALSVATLLHAHNLLDVLCMTRKLHVHAFFFPPLHRAATTQPRRRGGGRRQVCASGAPCILGSQGRGFDSTRI
jgi:hypothetical protein